MSESDMQRNPSQGLVRADPEDFRGTAYALNGLPQRRAALKQPWADRVVPKTVGQRVLPVLNELQPPIHAKVAASLVRGHEHERAIECGNDLHNGQAGWDRRQLLCARDRRGLLHGLLRSGPERVILFEHPSIAIEEIGGM